MAILTKGQTFANGDDVTSTKLHNLVDASAFVAGSSGTTDDSTLEVNGSGRLQVKDGGITTGKIGAGAVTTAKLADSTATTDGVTFAKIRQLEDMKVIGNVSGGTAAPTQVSILDEDDMTSDSAAAIPTQQSVKAYVDGKGLSGGQTGDAPTYGIRAWVNFDCYRNAAGGSDTANTNRYIRGSGNVTSVLKNAAGDFTIAFTAAMPNANYAVSIVASDSPAGGGPIGKIYATSPTAAPDMTTTYVRVAMGSEYLQYNYKAIAVMVVG